MRLSIPGTYLVIAAIVAPSLSANTLERVRERLQTLEASSQLSAEITHQIEGRSDENEPERGEVAVRVETRGESLAIIHRGDDLERLREEDRDPDPERRRPATRAMDSIEPSDIAALLDYAPRLLKDLEDATVTRRTLSRVDGRATTLLELELPVRLPEQLAKRISRAEATMNLWVLDDGTPVASERTIEGSGRFLILRFRGGESSTQSYRIRGDRLIVTNRTRQLEGAGFGREFSEKSWTRLTLD